MKIMFKNDRGYPGGGHDKIVDNCYDVEVRPADSGACYKKESPSIIKKNDRGEKVLHHYFHLYPVISYFGKNGFRHEVQFEKLRLQQDGLDVIVLVDVAPRGDE